MSCETTDHETETGVDPTVVGHDAISISVDASVDCVVMAPQGERDLAPSTSDLSEKGGETQDAEAAVAEIASPVLSATVFENGMDDGASDAVISRQETEAAIGFAAGRDEVDDAGSEDIAALTLVETVDVAADKPIPGALNTLTDSTASVETVGSQSSAEAVLAEGNAIVMDGEGKDGEGSADPGPCAASSGHVSVLGDEDEAGFGSIAQAIACDEAGESAGEEEVLGIACQRPYSFPLFPQHTIDFDHIESVASLRLRDDPESDPLFLDIDLAAKMERRLPRRERRKKSAALLGMSGSVLGATALCAMRWPTVAAGIAMMLAVAQSPDLLGVTTATAPAAVDAPTETMAMPAAISPSSTPEVAITTGDETPPPETPGTDRGEAEPNVTTLAKRFPDPAPAAHKEAEPAAEKASEAVVGAVAEAAPEPAAQAMTASVQAVQEGISHPDAVLQPSREVTPVILAEEPHAPHAMVSSGALPVAPVQVATAPEAAIQPAPKAPPRKAGPPAMFAPQNEIDIGEGAVGSSRKGFVVFEAREEATVSASNLIVDGAVASIDDTDCRQNGALTAGDRCVVIVEATPQRPGRWRVSVLMKHDGPGRSAVATLAGTGTEARLAAEVPAPAPVGTNQAVPQGRPPLWGNLAEAGMPPRISSSFPLPPPPPLRSGSAQTSAPTAAKPEKVDFTLIGITGDAAILQKKNDVATVRPGETAILDGTQVTVAEISDNRVVVVVAGSGAGAGRRTLAFGSRD